MRFSLFDAASIAPLLEMEATLSGDSFDASTSNPAL
jgi:hypothetical protein